MSDVGISVAKVDMPLTDFITALYRMTPEQRAAASAERAAERYGIRIDWVRKWIEEARKCNDVWPSKRREYNHE